MNEELWDNIQSDLYKITTDRSVDIIEVIVGAYSIAESGRIDLRTDQSQLELDLSLGIDLQLIEDTIKSYLSYLVWKFPNKLVEPFTLIRSIPEEKWEFIAWFVFVTFVQVNKELGELFNGKETLDENWLRYTLELSPYLKGQKFDINEYLNKNYYFNSMSIKFV